MWLLKKLRPDFKTIADFRKNNIKGIENTCREFTIVCKKLDLLGGELIAIDGSKFKACNSNKNFYSKKDIDKEIEKIDKKVKDYLRELDEFDDIEPQQKKLTSEELKEKIEILKSGRGFYEQLKEDMGEETQISLTDPDSRLLKDKKEYIVGYNVQTSVDSKHNLIVANDVIKSANDKNQLVSMTEKSQEVLASENLKVLADTGYYNEYEIVKLVEKGITPYILKPSGNPNDKKGLFTYNDFTYDNKKDVYVCPGKQELKLRGFGKNKKRLLKYYYTTSCKSCNIRQKCSKDKSGRRVARSVNANILEEMGQRVKQENVSLLRKKIVEHSFGTLKGVLDLATFS
jgi:transposase